MGKLFANLANNHLLSDWAETLDWLLDDKRFSREKGWNRGRVSKYTKSVKKLFNADANKKNFVCANLADLDISTGRRPMYPFVMMTNDGSIGKSLVRHIRNGIAHGNANIIKKGGETLIKIDDYNSKAKQTAHICIPLLYIPKMAAIYNEIEKAARNDRSNSSRKGRQ